MESWNILECLGIVTAKFLGWDEAWGLHGWHVVPFQVFPEDAKHYYYITYYNIVLSQIKQR